MKRQMVDMLADLIKSRATRSRTSRRCSTTSSRSPTRSTCGTRCSGSRPRRPSLPSPGQGGVVLSGHLDTPPIGDYWSFSQSQLAAAGCTGRGAADMKGTVIAMLQAAQDLVARKVPIVLALTTDEETTMQGAAALAKTLPMRRAKAIVVGEPNGLRVAYAEKGVLDLAIETRGKAAHGAMPHLGENAISKMMRMPPGSGELQGPHRASGARQRDDEHRHAERRRRINVVPNKATAEVDIRFPPPSSRTSCTGRSRSTCGGSRPRSRSAACSACARCKSTGERARQAPARGFERRVRRPRPRQRSGLLHAGQPERRHLRGR